MRGTFIYLYAMITIVVKCREAREDPALPGGASPTGNSPRPPIEAGRRYIFRGEQAMDEAGQEAPKTAQDLAIEQLRAEIAALKADQAKRDKREQDLIDANKGLYAELATKQAPAAAPAEPAPEKAGLDMDKAIEAFKSTMGVKEK